MKIIGLTGGIGMGKSTASAFFRRNAIPVFDADACVRELQAPGGRALPAIDAAFPGTIRDNRLDRAALRAAAIARPDGFAILNHIIHPMVREEELAFLARARRRACRAAVLDIPLLLETARRPYVDLILVVSAPKAVQVHRVLLRRTMDRAQVEAFIARQMPDRDKRRQADLVVNTGLSRFHALRTLRRFLHTLQA